MSADRDTILIKVDEPRKVPPLSVAFGAMPMVPFVVGAILAWTAGEWTPLFVDLTLLWGASILTFLAGVRRGVSFRTMGGPTRAQMLAMLWLFCLGSGSLLVTALSLGTTSVPPEAIASVVLAVGYASLVVLDPAAAARGEVPLFFQRLRPVQMPVPALALAAVALSVL